MITDKFNLCLKSVCHLKKCDPTFYLCSFFGQFLFQRLLVSLHIRFLFLSSLQIFTSFLLRFDLKIVTLQIIWLYGLFCRASSLLQDEVIVFSCRFFGKIRLFLGHLPRFTILFLKTLHFVVLVWGDWTYHFRFELSPALSFNQRLSQMDIFWGRFGR